MNAGSMGPLPLRWQALLIGLSLILVVSGCVFFLISVGGVSYTWTYLGAAFTSVGFFALLVGIFTCVCATRSDRYPGSRHSTGLRCGHKLDSEAQTLTTDSV